VQSFYASTPAVQIKDTKPGKTFKDDSGKELSFREVCTHVLSAKLRNIANGMIRKQASELARQMSR
jgi:hypothetical protein